MSDNFIEVRCVICGHAWLEDIDELKRQQGIYKAVVYRGASAKTQSYRARCPKDGTWVVVDVEEVDDA